MATQKEYQRRYYLEHRSAVLRRQKRHTQRPEVKARLKKYHQEWYLRNRDRIISQQQTHHSAPGYKVRKSEYDAQRFQRIRDQKLAAHKKWRDTHHEHQRMLWRRRRVRKLFLGGQHTAEDWLRLKQLYGFACSNCGRKEPEVKLSEDHKIPLSKGGTDNIDNIQPLCKSCNSSKGTRTWFSCRPVDKTWPNAKFSMFSLSLQAQPN